MPEYRANYRAFIKFTLIILAIRLCSLGLYDLCDSTESRYAGIALRMTESGDYVTPMADQTSPFLAKPPFSFWVTAISMKLFGANEFAARLPHFVFSVLLVLVSFFAFKRYKSVQFAYIFCLVISSTFGFEIMSGAVMTESCLVFFMSLSILSFYLIMEKNANKNWSYIFFGSFGFSMLVKGPIGVILVAFPMFVYLFIAKKWREFFTKFNLVQGICIFLIISLPWYILMEARNPGFLEYFFIGEHIKRFLVPSWKGDLYGFAHHQPIGMIWLFFCMVAFPWIFFYVYYLIKGKKKALSFFKASDLLFFLTALFPLLFFTFSRNVIFPYAIISVYPFAFLVSRFVVETQINRRIFIILAFINSVFVIVFVVTFPLFRKDVSDKAFIETAKELGAGVIYYSNTNPKFSGMFYTHDKSKTLALEQLSSLHSGNFVISHDLKLAKPLVCNHNNRCLYSLI